MAETGVSSDSDELADIVIEGYKAACTGEDRSTNPYKWGTTRWYTWEAGYDEGEDKDAAEAGQIEKMSMSPEVIAHRIRSDHLGG
jgi:ribosome modulation factor